LVESRPLQVLLNTLPQMGRVEWIGIRPARNVAMVACEAVQINLDQGLEGDRFSGRSGNPRQVTLIPFALSVTSQYCGVGHQLTGVER
jgi:hypothetical protein